MIDIHRGATGRELMQLRGNPFNQDSFNRRSSAHLHMRTYILACQKRNKMAAEKKSEKSGTRIPFWKKETVVSRTGGGTGRSKLQHLGGLLQDMPRITCRRASGISKGTNQHCMRSGLRRLESVCTSIGTYLGIQSTREVRP